MSNKLKGIFVTAILIMVIMSFLVAWIPQYEGSVDSSNITDGTTSTLVDMSAWVVPVLIVAGVIISSLGVMAVRRRRNRR